LGTGTGALAIEFARHGAQVTGLDISASQISFAKKLARQQSLQIKFVAAAAEDMNFNRSSAEVVAAAQAWIYFDTAVVIPKILRVLTHDGFLVLTHAQWLPHRDKIARETERLILKYNPDWTGAGYKGDIRPTLNSVKDDFDLKTFHVMNEFIEFTRESWRGRIRACRAIGASLDPADVAHFDEDHAKMLEQIAPDKFGILHQLAVHLFVRKGLVVDL
jgi:ubiquinone/menaquinone biosynthesis C-methylase UbiE